MSCNPLLLLPLLCFPFNNDHSSLQTIYPFTHSFWPFFRMLWHAISSSHWKLPTVNLPTKCYFNGAFIVHRYDTLRPKLLSIHFTCNFWSIYCTITAYECIWGCITWLFRLSISDFGFHSYYITSHIRQTFYKRSYKFWCWDGVVVSDMFASNNSMFSEFQLTEYTLTVWHFVN